MAKMRVHELAKELNMESKDVLHRLQAAGVSVKGPMSAIESKKADFLRQESPSCVTEICVYPSDTKVEQIIRPHKRLGVSVLTPGRIVAI